MVVNATYRQQFEVLGAQLVRSMYCCTTLLETSLHHSTYQILADDK